MTCKNCNGPVSPDSPLCPQCGGAGPGRETAPPLNSPAAAPAEAAGGIPVLTIDTRVLSREDAELDTPPPPGFIRRHIKAVSAAVAGILLIAGAFIAVRALTPAVSAAAAFSGLAEEFDARAARSLPPGLWLTLNEAAQGEGTVTADILYADGWYDGSGKIVLQGSVPDRSLHLSAHLDMFFEPIDLELLLNRECFALQSPLAEDAYYGSRYDRFGADFAGFAAMLGLGDENISAIEDFVENAGGIMNAPWGESAPTRYAPLLTRHFSALPEARQRRAETLINGKAVKCTEITYTMGNDAVRALLGELYDEMTHDGAPRGYGAVIGRLHAAAQEHPQDTLELVLRLFIGRSGRLLGVQAALDGASGGPAAIDLSLGAEPEDAWTLTITDGPEPPRTLTWRMETEEEKTVSALTAGPEQGEPVWTLDIEHDTGDTFSARYENEAGVRAVTGRYGETDAGFTLALSGLLSGASLDITATYTPGPADVPEPDYISADRWDESFALPFILVFSLYELITQG